MLPEYLILLTVPFVGLIFAAEAGTGISQRIAKRSGVRIEVAVLVIVLLVDVLVIGVVSKFLWRDSLFGIVDYSDVNDTIRRATIIQDLSFFDILLMTLSIVAAAVMAIRVKRNLGFWILMSVLANVGALAWLLRPAHQSRGSKH